MMITLNKCSKTVWDRDGWAHHPCGKPGKVLDPGGWRCGVHSDAAYAKRRAKSAERNAKDLEVGLRQASIRE